MAHGCFTSGAAHPSFQRLSLDSHFRYFSSRDSGSGFKFAIGKR
jgi:hypothetical protein